MIWKCKNKQIKYGKDVLIMGIVNVTPDSFSDGGDYFDAKKAQNAIYKLIDDGADIIDIGAQSTRPGNTPISEKEEWSRLESVLNAVNGKTNALISVDTYYPYVAEKSLERGADVINDVSGYINPEMAKVVKNAACGWIIMHKGHGSPAQVKEFFEKAIKECENSGIDKSSLCLDMGIGFGKTYEEDLKLIANTGEYKIDGFPILLGASRKRVIGKGSRQENPKERTYGNIAADTAAILGGADIIRTHDVLNEKHGIYMARELRAALNGEY